MSQAQLYNDLINRTIGAEPWFQWFYDNPTLNRNSNYPPVRITQKKHDEGTDYDIKVAVAGFTKDEISVTQTGKELKIEGSKTEIEGKDEDVLANTLAFRPFKLAYSLMEGTKVDTVTLEDGILNVKVNYRIPEEKKPITFKIE